MRIQTAAGATVHTADVGPTVSGAAFSWPAVPAGVLTPGVLYRYHAFTSDQYEKRPGDSDCYFVVDTELPAAPVISSTDYPNGGRVIAARTAGTVRFDPGGTDTDLAEYVYGFSQDRVTMRVRTGPDGKAAIPVTLWSTGGAATGRLYVRAVDQAGNTGAVSSWLLGANAPTGAVPHVRGDSNGDGKADITPVLDHGFGRTAVWNITSSTTAFHSGVMAWDTGQGGGYELHRTRFVQGDLDGDGRSDLALFRQGGGRRLSLYQLISDSNRYTAPPATWDSGPDGPSLTSSRFAAGDVTGDGRADVMMQTATAAGGWDAQIFTADTGFATPVSWVRATDPWSGSTPLLADVDGDGDADLVSMRNLTGCRTVIDLYRSTGSGFQPATQVYDSEAGNYCWERSKAASPTPTVTARTTSSRSTSTPPPMPACGCSGSTAPPCRPPSGGAGRARWTCRRPPCRRATSTRTASPTRPCCTPAARPARSRCSATARPVRRSASRRSAGRARSTRSPARRSASSTVSTS